MSMITYPYSAINTLHLMGVWSCMICAQERDEPSSTVRSMCNLFQISNHEN